MAINLQKHTVQKLRVAVWILLTVFWLWWFAVTFKLIPHPPEYAKTPLRLLLIVLFALQGIGIWWAQKMDKVQRERS